jgi:hypothetical protein
LGTSKAPKDNGSWELQDRQQTGASVELRACMTRASEPVQLGIARMANAANSMK